MFSILKNSFIYSGNLVKALHCLKRDKKLFPVLFQAIALLYLEGLCLGDIDYIKTDPRVQRKWKNVKSCALYWGVNRKRLLKKVKYLKDNTTVMDMLKVAYASKRSRSKALCSFSIITEPSDSLLNSVLSALENRTDFRVTWKLVFEARAFVTGANQMMTQEQKAVFKREFRQFLSRKGLAGIQDIELTRQTAEPNAPKKRKLVIHDITVIKRRVVGIIAYPAGYFLPPSTRIEKTVLYPDNVTWTIPQSLAPEIYLPFLVKEDEWKPIAVSNNTSCELFCGTAGISTRLFEKHGFSTTLVDKEDCRNDTNLNTFLGEPGFLKRDVLEMSVRLLKKLFSSRIIWLAPPCFTYSIQSQGTHKRNQGNGYLGVTAEAHYINNVLRLLLDWLKRLHLKEGGLQQQLVVFEAPEGVFEHTPFATELENLGLKPVRVSQCAWGCPLRKNTLLYTNSKELQKLERAHYCGRGNKGCTLKEGQGNHEEQGRGEGLKQHGAHYHPEAARAWADKLAEEVQGILNTEA